MSEVTDNALEIVKGLRGVRYAFYLDKETLEIMDKEEGTVVGSGNTAVDNEGFKEALKRQHVIAIIKDPRFRPPPEPTVVMLSGDTVIGEEVFPWTQDKYLNEKDAVWLSDGFVLLPSRMNGLDCRFVMPPVSFPELNPGNGCYDVISCSPAPTVDKMMREHNGYEDDSRFASVLIGFNEAGYESK